MSTTTQIITKMIAEYFKTQPILKAWLFGSFDRGYTGHEHLAAFGLINMNGRMYDPMMSSFLSVDRFVQSFDNSQSFNRYAYCLYNPLRYVDPSGWLPGIGNGRPDDPPGLDNYQPGTYNSADSDYACIVCLNEVTVTATSGGAPQSYSNTNYTEGNNWGSNQYYSYFGSSTNESSMQQKITISHGSGGNCGKAVGKNKASASSERHIVQSVGISYSIIGDVFYNNTFQVWLDKQWHFRGFDENGGRYIGGKLNYGKEISDIFKVAGNTISIIEEIYAIKNLVNSQSIEEGCEYFMDAFVGGMGFVPVVGTGVSLYWFTIGKTLHYNYVNQVIIPMIQQGDNPGLMIYQPFK